MKRLILLISFLSLQGCAYSSQFSCQSSRGMHCTPLSRVDEMIENGTIEKLDIDQKKQKLFKLGRNS